MKKIIVFVLTFFASCLVVNAAELHQITCKYENNGAQIEARYGYNEENGPYLSKLVYTGRSGGTLFNFDASDRSWYDGISNAFSAYQNKSYWLLKPVVEDFYKNMYSGTDAITQGYNTHDFFEDHYNYYFELESDSTMNSALCPTNFYYSEDTKNFYACGTVVSTDWCPAIERYVEANEGNVTKFTKTTSIHTSNGSGDNNVEDAYIENEQQLEEARQLEEEYCSTEYIAEHGSSDCTNIRNEIDTLEGNKEDIANQAGDMGISENELDAAYSSFKNNLEWEEGGCASYLGHIDDPNAPAYYLKFAFNLIKYAAIVLLFVFTIVEFAKAVASSKDDAIKKASQNTVKRLIIAVIIFFLPLLIDFVFDILGIVETDPTCNIINANINR